MKNYYGNQTPAGDFAGVSLISFLAEIDTTAKGAFGGLKLTREGMFDQAWLDHMTTQERIIRALAPADDEEIIITFTKSKK